MAKIGLPKGSGKWLKVREKSVKSQGILKWILSGNPDNALYQNCTNGITPLNKMATRDKNRRKGSLSLLNFFHNISF